MGLATDTVESAECMNDHIEQTRLCHKTFHCGNINELQEHTTNTPTLELALHTQNAWRVILMNKQCPKAQEQDNSYCKHEVTIT